MVQIAKKNSCRGPADFELSSSSSSTQFYLLLWFQSVWAFSHLNLLMFNWIYFQLIVLLWCISFKEHEKLQSFQMEDSSFDAIEVNFHFQEHIEEKDCWREKYVKAIEPTHHKSWNVFFQANNLSHLHNNLPYKTLKFIYAQLFYLAVGQTFCDLHFCTHFLDFLVHVTK